MKCNEVDKHKRHHRNLDNLDRALHDLEMLSAVTEARRECLREQTPDFCMMRLNSRYTRNVTVGYCMKRTTTKNRLCPYLLPVRHRTKSENSDAVTSDLSECNREYKSWLEPSTSGYQPEASPAKRCQSLENLNLTDTSPEQQDLDRVSTQIQKLQVEE